MFDPKGFNFDKLLSNLYLYTGIFLNDKERDKLLNLCPPIHPNVYADHVTLQFRPSPDEVMKLEHWTDDHGEDLTLFPRYMVSDDKGQVVSVNAFGRCESTFPRNPQQELHITISCAEGTSPVYSNRLLQERSPANSHILWSTNPSIKGILGVCAQTDRNYLSREQLRRRGLVTL